MSENNKITEEFKKISRTEKIAFVVTIFSSIAIIICASLQLTEIVNIPPALCPFLSGITMISLSVLQWNINRGVAIFLRCVAVFDFIVAVITLVR